MHSAIFIFITNLSAVRIVNNRPILATFEVGIPIYNFQHDKIILPRKPNTPSRKFSRTSKYTF